MAYQVCRWYDHHPRLAFALRLLYLAPANIQQQAGDTLAGALKQYEWAFTQTRPIEGPTPTGKRWYDRTPATGELIERIKTAPDSLKTRIADRLLSVFE